MSRPRRGQAFRVGSGSSGWNGLIWNVDSEGNIEYFNVEKIIGKSGVRILCYDDDGAIFDRDRNNVRVLDCPPPFSDMGIISFDGERVGNAYAIADTFHPCTMNRMVFDRYASITDNGKTISDRAMAVIKNHPWPNQKHRELSRREDTVDDDLRDMGISVEDIVADNPHSDDLGYN